MSGGGRGPGLCRGGRCGADPGPVVPGRRCDNDRMPAAATRAAAVTRFTGRATAR